MQSKAWPYEEARKLLKRWPDGKASGAPIVFETGYGPSGLPHIGTFNEVARTTFVRNAFKELSDQPTRLIAFSDDMDGLRKVPDNVPNQELLHQHLGKPLTRIPDPFGSHDSFAAHNNARLCSFLDRFGFDYEFYSATQCYASGRFDEVIRQVLRNWDAVMDVMLPTLREERRRTYSPILPISPSTGVVLQVPVEVVDAEQGIIAFQDKEQRIEQSALGGNAKLQWKVDWAARWVALGVDYEMAGKDLIDSVVVSGKIARILGGRPPEGFNYEMFLDENGEKISKSKGNGLSLEEWLRYGSEESLAFYIYREPKKAKSLHIGVIPRAVDEYFQFRMNYPSQPVEQQLGNPVHHIHAGKVPMRAPPVTYGLLLNLVSLPGVGDRETAWRFVQRYMPKTSPETHPELDKLIELAVNYARDFVAPNLKRRPPTQEESKALRDLDSHLAGLPADADGEKIQHLVFEIGKQHYGKENLRSWFQALYEILLGSTQGPRMGSFIALYGIENSRRLVEDALGA